MYNMTRINTILDAQPGHAIETQRIEIAREHVADVVRPTDFSTLEEADRNRNIGIGNITARHSRLGPICAAVIIGHTGNIDRFASKAHFASYNATAPIEASSGDECDIG